MFRSFISLLLFVNISCKSNVLIFINLSDYEEYSLKEEHTSVILLKSFVTKEKCDGLKNIYYANIFMCKTTISNDTILVFTVCKKPYDFLNNGYKWERDLIIDSNKLSKNYPKKVLANIDELILKRKYKFIFGDLIKLEY